MNEYEYIKSFDHEVGAWMKKGEAVAFGDFLAAELGINRKGVVWEKDGKHHRLRVPLISRYWHPINDGNWNAELFMFKKALKAGAWMGTE